MQPQFSQEELERQYSPSSCIGGDYSQYLRLYDERSAAEPSACRVFSDLAYGHRQTNRIDLITPNSTLEGVAPPLLVFVHGGYWQELSKRSSLFAAAECIRRGVVFAAIDYTLAPEATILEMALECRQALRWLHSNSSRFGFDPRRIVIAGSSAGAHLAAMTCVRGWRSDPDLPGGLPAAAVLVSGIYDLRPLIGTTINAPLGLAPDSAEAVSPMLLATADFPPVALCWGEIETEEFKRQSREFACALQSAGTHPLRSFEIPGRNHFDVILDLARPDTLLGDATLQLLTTPINKME